jgi:DNA polymerase III sliding clamp (beta) subunit (PCNA family)
MISYLTFMKHASKITKAASELRPTLKGVYHRSDGTLIVTDSHQLYKAEGLYFGAKNQIINPVSGELVEGIYPDTDQTIPPEPKAQFKILQVGKLSKLTKILWEAARYPEDLEQKPESKQSTLLRITQREGKVWLQLPENKAMNGSIQIGSSDKEIKLSVRANYLFDALELFRDCGFDELTAEYSSEMRPLVFRQENLLALILPVRVF